MWMVTSLGTMMAPSVSLADKQEFVMDEHHPLTVEVSKDGLSSLCVKGDRIKEVLGLSEGVAVDKDESNGLLFLRGVKNKEHITILTEGGEMQDVVLKPSAKGSTRIIFTIKQTSEQPAPLPQPTPFSYQKSFKTQSIHHQDSVIAVMKQMQLGMGSSFSAMNRTPKEGFKLTPQRAVVDQQLHAEVYEVQNVNDNTTHVLEKDFYERGDVALSLSKRQVKAGETFYLYVVRAHA